MGVTENYTRTGVESLTYGKYNITNADAYVINVCYMQNITSGDSAWQLENPLVNNMPGLAIQISFQIFLTRILMYIFKPLGQQRFLAEATAGVLVGPTLFGKTRVAQSVYTFEANLVLETFASFALTYYMFLVGLEIDLSVLKRMGAKTRSLAIATVMIPMGVGGALYFIPMRTNTLRNSVPLGSIFWAITVSITSFPDLARILSDFKILHTDIGRMALVTSIGSEITAWVLLVAAITVFDEHKFLAAALPTTVFIIICWFVVRPGIVSMIHKTKKEGKKFGDIHISCILAAVAACGFITDACGSHSMIGGFMLGLIIPNGELAITIMERIGEFVNGIMMPTFMTVNGIRTNLSEIPTFSHITPVIGITLAAASAKIVSSLMVALFLGLSIQDGLSLGALMNTKGVLALIVLNEGRNLQLLDNVTMTVMMLSILFMTALVGPIFHLVNENSRNNKRYKLRTIQRSNPNTQLRVMTCLHSVGNLSGFINLLEVSHPTRKSPLNVFVVHLVELIGRASALLIVQETATSNNAVGNNNSSSSLSREKAESEQIFTAFDNFVGRNDAVTAQPLTVVSPYATMHEDIIRLAEDKRVAMILIPYHKQMTASGVVQSENHSVKDVNSNLLRKAPCSVGLLIDRGLGLLLNSSSNYRAEELRFAVFFIGGPDDQEALSYAYRMSGTAGVNLTVVRFLPGKDAEQHIEKMESDDELDGFAEIKSMKERDDEFINEFRFKSMSDPSVTYYEKIVNDGEELLESIKSKYVEKDLYIVGRGNGVETPLTMGLLEWSEDPELGAIGEALVSSEFAAQASILVVQQPDDDEYLVGGGRAGGGKFAQKKWASPILNPNYEIFQNRRKEAMD